MRNLANTVDRLEDNPRFESLAGEPDLPETYGVTPLAAASIQASPPLRRRR
ncbi:MAG TPA: hypothetical protein VEO54_09795 [Thermoanaerobaculia bacterium]|nr:hypothetical protein [Thermoanaerobaculia bacterium]